MARSFVSEGTIPFAAPGTDKQCYTWYRIYGELSSNAIPLVALHGGPGAGHEYLTNLQDLTIQHQIPVVLYDQIGCGKSTALPEKNGVESFWTVKLFEQELVNLLEHLKISEFHLLGHSWGGMFGSIYASKRPSSLRKLILMGTPASVDLMLQGAAELTKQLPQWAQDAVREAEESQDYDSPAYKEASMEFYKRFLCRCEPWPAELVTSMSHLEEDPTVYKTMYGPSEMVCKGNLRDWTAVPSAHRIRSSTLLINGRYDQVVESATAPYFEKIPKVKRVVFEESSHVSNWEERERFMNVVFDFLLSID